MELKEKLHSLIRNNIQDTIEIFIDTRKEKINPLIINIGIIYGMYGFEMVKISLIRLDSESPFQIFSIKGDLQVNIITSINQDLKEIK